MGEHDAFFKRIFSNPAYAADELAAVLPPTIVGLLDLSKLELMPGSFVDEALSHRHTDLLFRAPVRAHRRRGRPKWFYVYVLFEHLSGPSGLVAFRLLQYMERIWAQLLLENPRLKKLPPILPLVVHHGPGGWRGPRCLHDVLDGLDEFPALRPLVPNFELLIDDLAVASNDQLLARPLGPIPKVATWLLRDGRRKAAFRANAAAWGPEIQRAIQVAPGEIDALVSYLMTIAGPGAWPDYEQTLRRIAPTIEASMISYADHLRQSAREEGRQEGRQEAQADMLRRVLRERFGRITADLDARIDGLSSEALMNGILRAMSAVRAEDVFDGI